MQPLKEAVQFLQQLNHYNVEYLIIGGAAVNVHGYTRATGDLDIWYNPTQKNFENLIAAIESFGFDVSPLKTQNPSLEKSFIRIPLDFFSVELLSMIDGNIKFDEAYTKPYFITLENIQVPVIGYDDLIENKIMSRRPKDLEDIAQLEKRKGKSQN